jgi:hypothetical protein
MMKNKQEVDPIITCYIHNEDHIPITDFESKTRTQIQFDLLFRALLLFISFDVPIKNIDL